MAKFESTLTGSFDSTLSHLENRIIQSGESVNLVDASDFSAGDVRCAVRVYDKYFMRNGNRASLTLTLAGQGTNLFVSAIGAGGGSGIVFNFSLGAERSMVSVVERAVDELKSGR